MGICVSPQHNATHTISIPEIGGLAAILPRFFATPWRQALAGWQGLVIAGQLPRNLAGETKELYDTLGICGARR